MKSVADPGFSSRGGGQPPRWGCQHIIRPIFPQKLHEHERNWIGGGGMRPWRLIRSANVSRVCTEPGNLQHTVADPDLGNCFGDGGYCSMIVLGNSGYHSTDYQPLYNTNKMAHQLLTLPFIWMIWLVTIPFSPFGDQSDHSNERQRSTADEPSCQCYITCTVVTTITKYDLQVM